MDATITGYIEHVNEIQSDSRRADTIAKHILLIGPKACSLRE